MEERDDWKLGDEGEAPTCPRCGKRNRAGLSYCTICGSALTDQLEPDDSGSLRTISEAMGGKRRPASAPRRSLRGWSIAAGLLLLIVVVLTWQETREEPFRLEDLKFSTRATPPTEIASPVATTVPTRVVVATRVPPPPTPVAAVAPPPVATAVASLTPLPRATATARPTARPTPVRTRRPRPTPVPAVEPAQEPPPVDRPRIEATEKPSLGTDLQDATRAYRQAVEAHNQRVDEYNALADEIQRRNAWDDSQSSVELRRRLDRAREAVENARVQAEMLRTQMEAVRTRYR